LEVAPVGIAEQWNINGDASRSLKYHLTHDQSFETTSGYSVDKRVISQDRDDLYYGYCFSRVVHFIVSLRKCHLCTKILGCKTDIKAAYRRIALNGDTVARCFIIFKQWGLASL
jgi:hypothetical protein